MNKRMGRGLAILVMAAVAVSIVSITYTSQDFTVESGRMMTFYTYDPVTSVLENRAELPFESQYALGRNGCV